MKIITQAEAYTVKKLSFINHLKNSTKRIKKIYPSGTLKSLTISEQ
jgi:hypothetical protein